MSADQMEAAQQARAFLKAIDIIVERHGRKPTMQMTTEVRQLVERAVNSGEGEALMAGLAAECEVAERTMTMLGLMLIVEHINTTAALSKAKRNGGPVH